MAGNNLSYESAKPDGRAHPLCEAQRRKAGCRVLLGFVVTFQSYYYFSSGVSFIKILHRLGSLT